MGVSEPDSPEQPREELAPDGSAHGASQANEPLRADFLWGAATSAHQVEGNNENSDWWSWEQTSPGSRRERSGRSADHWHRWYDDLALLAELGLNAYRFSVEWARVEPSPGTYDQEAIDHYRRVAARCAELDITPLVTLNHFTLPRWLAERGGWLEASAAGRFAAYVAQVAPLLADEGVRWWTTVNEPDVLVVQGFLAGIWPPEEHSPAKAARAHRALLRAHRLAYEAIHAAGAHHAARAGLAANAIHAGHGGPGATDGGPGSGSTPQVGIAQNMIHFLPWRPGNPADRAAAALQRRLFDQAFLDQARRTLDFIGLNYYTHSWSRGGGLKTLLTPVFARPGERTTQMGWAWAPEGFGAMLDLVASYGKPVLVTENGIATDDDRERVEFIRLHVNEMKKAVQRGVDVRGYFHWALLDNFEWAEGFRPRFWLIGVDYGSLERQVRPSARFYGEIARQGGLLPGAGAGTVAADRGTEAGPADRGTNPATADPGTNAAGPAVDPPVPPQS